MAERSLEDIDRKARDFFLKGRDALERKNYDYAISLFLNVLNIEPDFVAARKILRLAQSKKFEQSGGVFKKAAVAARYGAQLMMARRQVRKKPAEMMKFAEQVLSEDPSNTLALQLLTDAALELKMFETAVLSMESIAEANPKNLSVLHKLAAVYNAAGHFDKARNTFDRILELNPADVKAKTGIRDAEAARSMKEGNWETATSFRDALKDKDETRKLDSSSRVYKGAEMLDAQIRELESQLVNDAENLGLLRKLGDLHADRGNYDRAVEYYSRVLELSASADPSLEAKITDTISKKFDSHIAESQAAAEKDPASQELARQVENLQKQKRDYLLQRAEQLVTRYPNEPQYHFDLGYLYYQEQRYDDAVREFQQAVRSPKHRIVTLNCLGLCYLAKKVIEIARDQFLKADAEHRTMDPLKKEIIYNLGLAYEQAGDHAQAYEQFKRIYEVDIGYKDVRARVESRPKK